MIVDLSPATFVESSILGALTWAHKQAAAEGNVLVLQLGTAPVMDRVIKITRLDEVLDWTQTRQEALARIRERTVGTAA